MLLVGPVPRLWQIWVGARGGRAGAPAGSAQQGAAAVREWATPRQRSAVRQGRVLRKGSLVGGLEPGCQGLPG